MSLQEHFKKVDEEFDKEFGQLCEIDTLNETCVSCNENVKDFLHTKIKEGILAVLPKKQIINNDEDNMELGEKWIYAGFNACLYKILKNLD